MVTVRTTTHLSAHERAQVLEFLDTAHLLDCAQLNDHLHIDLAHGPRPGFVAALATDGDELVAYGQASSGNAGHVMDAIVSSQYVGDHDATLTAVLRQLLDQLPADCRVTWWAPSDLSSQAIATSLGLHVDRRLLMMEVALPTTTSTALVVRPFRVGIDEEAWLEVNNAAFAAHGEQGGWDLATLHQRQAEEWFDPRAFLLHERDGRLAGFCWVKMHPATDTAPTGEIYVIAVHPDFHGLGLGRDLTVAGLQFMSSQGAADAMLYVDATNTAAVGLYRSLGFETAHTEQSYLRPARS